MALLEQNRNDEAATAYVNEEKADSESGSEGGTSALTLRRRVASDVEDDDYEVSADREDTCFDNVEEDQGSHPDEDADHEEEEGEEDGEEYEDVTEEAAVVVSGSRDASDKEDTNEEVEGPRGDRETKGAGGSSENALSSSNDGPEDEKQTTEPFVVPTLGAFYMHDDRFQNNGAIRPRRNPGGRKLWDAKDEKRWVHDRFEELKLDEESYISQGGKGRRGRGREGRGQGRGQDSGSVRGRSGRDRSTDEGLGISARRVRGRGRGLRRARMDDYEFREAKSASHIGVPLTPRQTGMQPTGNPKEATSKKATMNSVLNSKSPPFFPTGAVTQNIMGGQPRRSKDEGIEKDTMQAGGSLVGTPRSGMEKGSARGSPQSLKRSSSSPGNIVKVVSDSSVGKSDGLLRRTVPRNQNTMQHQVLKGGSGSMSQQRPLVTEGNMRYVVERPSVPQPIQPTAEDTLFQPLRAQQQQLPTVAHGQVSKGQPVQEQSLVSSIPLLVEPAVDSKRAPQLPGNKMANVASGRTAQAAPVASGRGSLLYGSSSLNNSLHSVVQFAGQSQPNLGVPTVGVALPSYSNQPQFGFPNSEVTWIPILAGGGSLGSNYGSSYIAVDGSSPAVYYTQQTSHTQQASQTSAFPDPGRDLNTVKAAASSSSFEPPARSESDEFGQHRRRYSQMTFGEEHR